MAARSENMAVIIGNLTRDPELRHTPQGHAVVGFGVARTGSGLLRKGRSGKILSFTRLLLGIG